MTKSSDYIVIDEAGISSKTIKPETIANNFFGIKEIQYIDGVEKNFVVVRTLNLESNEVSNLRKFKFFHSIESLNVSIAYVTETSFGLVYNLTFKKE